MGRSFKRKTPARDPLALRRAFAATVLGMPCKGAARKYNVPRSTLQDHWKNNRNKPMHTDSATPMEVDLQDLYVAKHGHKTVNKTFFVTDSVRCVVGVRCQAITQIKQLFAGSVLGWVTAGPRPAHRNTEREVMFQRLLDWGQTVNWPTVSAQVIRSFPVPSCKCDTA